MKVLAFFFLFIACLSHAQPVRRLNDPAIVAQHKRQVFESWGDFRPYPKYVLGIQTNFAYATVWGWMAPSRNREYKNGPDIRPLKPTGLEVQRLVAVEQQRKEAEEIKLQVDSLYTRNVQDFAHWTSATVEADPMWLLYYKQMLKELNRFPDRPSNYLEWKLEKKEVYDQLVANGGIQKLQEELDILKDQYKQSRTQDMPRGKRFLLYHATLLGWRNFTRSIRNYNNRITQFLEFRRRMSQFGGNGVTRPRNNDVLIVKEIMTKYHNKF